MRQHEAGLPDAYYRGRPTPTAWEAAVTRPRSSAGDRSRRGHNEPAGPQVDGGFEVASARQRAGGAWGEPEQQSEASCPDALDAQLCDMHPCAFYTRCLIFTWFHPSPRLEYKIQTCIGAEVQASLSINLLRLSCAQLKGSRFKLLAYLCRRVAPLRQTAHREDVDRSLARFTSQRCTRWMLSQSA